MTIEDALNLLDVILGAKPLNDLQEYVFCQTWDGRTYTEIAYEKNHDPDYIKHVGYQLWKLLSGVLGQKVTKSNLRVVLRRHSALKTVVSELDRLPVVSLDGAAHLGNGNGHGNGNGKSVSPTAPNGRLVETFMQAGETITKDWDETSDRAGFSGRTVEVTTLNQWLVQDRNRLIALLGVGGIGKTALATAITQYVDGEF